MSTFDPKRTLLHAVLGSPLRRVRTGKFEAYDANDNKSDKYLADQIGRLTQEPYPQKENANGTDVGPDGVGRTNRYFAVGRATEMHR